MGKIRTIERIMALILTFFFVVMYLVIFLATLKGIHEAKDLLTLFKELSYYFLFVTTTCLTIRIFTKEY